MYLFAACQALGSRESLTVGASLLTVESGGAQFHCPPSPPPAIPSWTPKGCCIERINNIRSGTSWSLDHFLSEASEERNAVIRGWVPKKVSSKSFSSALQGKCVLVGERSAFCLKREACQSESWFMLTGVL